jgi:hypothetical protein
MHPQAFDSKFDLASIKVASTLSFLGPIGTKEQMRGISCWISLHKPECKWPGRASYFVSHAPYLLVGNEPPRLLLFDFPPFRDRTNYLCDAEIGMQVTRRPRVPLFLKKTSDIIS